MQKLYASDDLAHAFPLHTCVSHRYLFILKQIFIYTEKINITGHAAWTRHRSLPSEKSPPILTEN